MTILQDSPAIGIDSTFSTAFAHHIFLDAHTAVSFVPEILDAGVVDEIYETIKFGPTAMNSLPLRLRVGETAQARADLTEIVNPGNRGKIETAPLIVIASAAARWHETLSRTAPHMKNPADIFGPKEPLRRDIARMNGSLQLAYFMMGARGFGYDVAPMTGYDAAALAERFLSGTDEELLAVVAIGHRDPSADHPRAPRLSSEEAVQHI